MPSPLHAPNAGKRSVRSSPLWLACLAGLVLLSGCGTQPPLMRDAPQNATQAAPLTGVVLVLAMFGDPTLDSSLERAFVAALKERGIDASAAHGVLPGTAQPGTAQLSRSLREGGYDSLLLSRLEQYKHVERETTATQVALVETTLFLDAGRIAYWRVDSENFLLGPGELGQVGTQQALVEAMVADLLAAMQADGVL